jgi:hypothetical protein
MIGFFSGHPRSVMASGSRQFPKWIGTWPPPGADCPSWRWGEERHIPMSPCCCGEYMYIYIFIFIIYIYTTTITIFTMIYYYYYYYYILLLLLLLLSLLLLCITVCCCWKKITCPVLLAKLLEFGMLNSDLEAVKILEFS